MIKLLVFDMDGTLLNEDDKITKDTKDAILACEDKGIKVILASGRSYNRLLPYGEILRLAEYDGKFIEVNGTAIYDVKTGDRKIIKQLTKAEMIEMWKTYLAFDVEIQIYFDKGIYYYIPEVLLPLKEKERQERGLSPDFPLIGGPWTWLTDNRAGYPEQKRVYDFDDLKLDLYNKFNASGDPEVIESIMAFTHKKYDENYEVARSCPRMLELTPKGITKGETLRKYMQETSLKRDEVMVFGDGENDIDMFKSSDFSFAMENATDNVKKEARYIAPSNREDGIAKILHQYIIDPTI